METNKEKFDQDTVSPYQNSIDFDVELCSIVKPELSDDMMKIEKNLVKRLDYIYVMPCLCMLVIIQFFDKSALNYSSVLGIKEDNNLDDTQFGWLGSIFFIGYLFYQIPNAYFVQKLNLGRYLGTLILTWGAILGLTSVSKNFAHLAVFRFFLGVFEAGVFPCSVMLISRVYRRKEQAARIGTIYFTGGVAMTVGGILSYGIGHMDGIAGMKAWQWVMIILGGATVIFGFICFFLLIDDANHISKSDDERTIIGLRVKDNAVVVTRTINYSQIMEALKESRFYCFAAFSFFVSLQNGALSVFSSIITQGFGYSNLNAILLSIPSGVMDCIFIFIAIPPWDYYCF
ncbi:hypothetical protein MFLAVUS_005652 [Mucor flavus]|uniref:Major facilitator superfamily (MFS) profile domain-containing protein n=1 Tax=Mucor flavus TaxID=439312 RepID=A0ABP9YZB0_9FUNG